MPTVIIYTRPDGGVSYICPWYRLPDAADGSEVFDKYPPWREEGDSDADCERKCAERLVPLVVTLTPAQRTEYVLKIPREEDRVRVQLAGVPMLIKPAVARRIGAVGPQLPWRIVPAIALPNRRFRDAWQHDNGVVSVHMGKAREIRKRELIGYTEPDGKFIPGQVDVNLDRLNRAAVRADAKGDGAATAKIKKQLKDLASLDDAIIDTRLAVLATPEALAAYSLPELE